MGGRAGQAKRKRRGGGAIGRLLRALGRSWVFLALSAAPAVAHDTPGPDDPSPSPSGRANRLPDAETQCEGKPAAFEERDAAKADGAISIDTAEFGKFSSSLLDPIERRIPQSDQPDPLLSAPPPAAREAHLTHISTLQPAPPAQIDHRDTLTPLIWGGRTLGEVALRVESGRVSFSAEQFAALADHALDARTRELLPVLEIGGRLTPFSLDSSGVSVRYDEARRALTLEIRTQSPAPAHFAVASIERAALSPSAPPVLESLPQGGFEPLTAPTPQPAALLTPTALETQRQNAPTAPAAPIPQPPPAPPPAPAAEITPIQADAPMQTARPTRQLEFIYPLMIDDRYLGDVPIRFEPDGAVSLSVARLIELAEPLLDPLVTASIRERAVEDRIRPFEDASGVALVFDDSLQELRLVAPGALRRSQTLSLSGLNISDNANARIEHAEPLSAFITLDVTQSYNHDNEPSREPLQAIIDTGFRLFGDKGVAFEGRGFYDEASVHEFRRGEARLIYDHIPSMISTTLGDLRYGAAGFQSGPPMGGLSVERLFSLQPNRNYRPAGRRAFVLDRRTTVTVLVNGVELRRLDLLPGRYSLEDFPMVEGANDVTLILEDEFGRREVIDMRSYFDIELLAQGVSEFSYAIGAPSTSEADGIAYQSDVLQYSMFHRIGVLSNLTLGVNAQGLGDAHLYGGEVLLASPLGVFGLDVAHSENPDVGEGDAALLRYELQPRPGDGLTWSFGLSSQWQSPQFAAIDATAAFTTYEYQHDASLRLYHPDWGTLSLSASYDQPYATGGEERIETSLGYSRRLFGDIYGAFQVNHIEEGDSTETFGAFSLSLRLGRRQQMTARHSTRTGLSELEWQRSGSYGVGGISANARIGHNEETGEDFGGGAVSYFANRFELTATSDARTVGLENDELSTRSSVHFGSSLAYAGSRVALGRPIRGGFAIVGTHDSLDGHKVILGGGDRPRAMTGWFGPALVPDLGLFTPESVGIDVDNLPPGYDLGAGQLDFRAVRSGGYDIEIGSAASVTVMATLVGPDGAPIAMAGGELRSLDDPHREPVQAFTNRNGRFAAPGVAPGRHLLVLFTDPQLQAELNIEEDTVGLVQLGTIEMRESQ